MSGETQMGRLDNKVAIVTGAAMGIGKAAALAMAKEGAKIAIADLDDAAGNATSEEIRQAGGEAFFQHTDVGKSADVQAVIEATVTRYGKLDVMFNNAGVAISGSADEISEDDWNRVLNINLGGVWRGIKYAVPHMIRNGGGSTINSSLGPSLLGVCVWAAD